MLLPEDRSADFGIILDICDKWFSPYLSLVGDAWNMRVCILGGNKPNSGSFSDPNNPVKNGNPVKLLFSVRVENTFKSRFDCQNKAEMHLT